MYLGQTEVDKYVDAVETRGGLSRQTLMGFPCVGRIVSHLCSLCKASLRTEAGLLFLEYLCSGPDSGVGR